MRDGYCIKVLAYQQSVVQSGSAINSIKVASQQVRKVYMYFLKDTTVVARVAQQVLLKKVLPDVRWSARKYIFCAYIYISINL